MEKIELLYDGDDIVLEKFENGKYRVSFFNNDSNWIGDIIFSKESGVIFDDMKDVEDQFDSNIHQLAEYISLSVGGNKTEIYNAILKQ